MHGTPTTKICHPSLRPALPTQKQSTITIDMIVTSGELMGSLRILRSEFFDCRELCHRFPVEVSGSLFDLLPQQVYPHSCDVTELRSALLSKTRVNRLRRRGTKLWVRGLAWSNTSAPGLPSYLGRVLG